VEPIGERRWVVALSPVVPVVSPLSGGREVVPPELKRLPRVPEMTAALSLGVLHWREPGDAAASPGDAARSKAIITILLG
jgi:hypothetical protein